MKMLLRVLVSLLVLLASVTSVLAANEIKLEATPVTDQVEPGQSSVFELKVTNFQSGRDIFRLKYDELAVNPFSDFVSVIKVDPSQVKIDSLESAVFRIEIQTLDEAKTETFFTTDVEVFSLTKPQIHEGVTLKTYTISPTDAIVIEAEIPESIIPGEEGVVKVRFRNRANVDLENVELQVSSNLASLNKNVVADFEGGEEITEEIVVRTEKTNPSGEYIVNVRVYEGDKLRGSYSSTIVVVEREDVETVQEEDASFLASTVTIAKKNNGNTREVQRIEAKAGWLRRAFMMTNPPARVEEGRFVWEAELDPGEELRVQVATSYRPVFYGLLIVIVATMVMVILIERSVTIKKRIFKVKKTKEGVNEFKVLIHVRNGKPLRLKGVKVYDILPEYMEGTKEFGTLEPTRTQQGPMGRRYIWEIGELEPREERVLSYMVRSRVHLVGEASLPPAALHYTTMTGKIKVVKSGKLVIHQRPVPLPHEEQSHVHPLG